jgi:hypothetical protein
MYGQPVKQALFLAVAATLLSASPSHADHSPRHPYTVEEQPPHCSDTVCVHWVDSTPDAPYGLHDDADGDGVADPIEMVRDLTEEALDAQVGGMGWRAPLSDELEDPDPRFDVYLRELGDAADGSAHADLTWHGIAASGHISLDDELSYRLRYQRARTVLAHEVHHVIQFAYQSFAEGWAWESGATWMTDRYDPVASPLLSFIPSWTTATEAPLALRHGDPQWLKAYAAAVWWRWLADQHGPDVVRATWERTRPDAWSFHLGSLDDELRGRGSSFAGEFARFAAANAEWSTGGSGFTASSAWVDVERVGSLAEGEPATVSLDHTTFALLDVPVRSGDPLALDAALPAGLTGAAALVGRPADGGPPVVELAEARSGGDVRVRLRDPGRFSRVTAVLVNADAERVSGEPSSAGDWTYRRDDQAIRARVTVERPTAPTAPLPHAAPPPAPPPTPAGDTRAPLVRLTVGRRQVLRGASSPLRLSVLVDEASLVGVDVRSGRRIVGRVARPRVAPGTALKLSFRPDRALRRLLLRRGRASVTVTVQAIDAKGNRTVRKARVVLVVRRSSR